MPSIQTSGTLPSAMAENSRAVDWAATLAATGQTSLLSWVGTIGPDAAYFTAVWDMALRIIRLTPAALADAEALEAAGRPLHLDFGLRFRFQDGHVEDTAPDAFRVIVEDRDDTPPQQLRFATGGIVAADALGVEVGRLAVVDPDTSGPFQFFLADDEWRFEVVDGALRLRSGVNLGLDAMGTLPLQVTVHDGRQAAAFTLEVTVVQALDPAPVGGLVLTRGEDRVGFAYGGGDAVLTLRDVATVAAITPISGGIREVETTDGASVWLPAAARLRLTEGFVEFAPEGTAMRAAALRAALGGEAVADARRLGRDVASLEGGRGWVDFAADLLPGAAPADGAFVAGLFQAALGRAPDAAEEAMSLGRLAAGLAREQLAVDVVLAPAALTRFADAHAGGIWVFQPLGSGAAEDPGLPGAAPAPIVPPDLFFL